MKPRVHLWFKNLFSQQKQTKNKQTKEEKKEVETTVQEIQTGNSALGYAQQSRTHQGGTAAAVAAAGGGCDEVAVVGKTW